MPVPPLPNLGQADPKVKEAIDRLRAHSDKIEQNLVGLGSFISSLPAALTLDQIAAALSATGSHPLNLAGLVGSNAPPVLPVPVPPVAAPANNDPNTPPTEFPCNTDFATGQPNPIPGPSVRWYRGNFCGVRVAGIAPVPGGSSDSNLVFTPFIDRYNDADQAAIFDAHRARGFTHFQVSWPDSRGDGGQSVDQFVATCQKLQANSFYPVVFLSAKGDPPDPGDLAGIVNPVITQLIAAGAVATFCVGWELSLFMDPTQTQGNIDSMASLIVPAGIPLYVHFQSNYTSFPQPGAATAEFWNANVGKLTGLYYQADFNQDCGARQERIIEGLTRFAGNDGYATDSGFGHPWDFVPWELSAYNQFFNGMSENIGNSQGYEANLSPAQTGPAGVVGTIGYGNGSTYPEGGSL